MKDFTAWVRRSTPRSAGQSPQARLSLQALEDRTVPSGFRPIDEVGNNAANLGVAGTDLPYALDADWLEFDRQHMQSSQVRLKLELPPEVKLPIDPDAPKRAPRHRQPGARGPRR